MTILFTDFKVFTEISSRITPAELVAELTFDVVKDEPDMVFESREAIEVKGERAS